MTGATEILAVCTRCNKPFTAGEWARVVKTGLVVVTRSGTFLWNESLKDSVEHEHNCMEQK